MLYFLIGVLWGVLITILFIYTLLDWTVKKAVEYNDIFEDMEG